MKVSKDSIIKIINEELEAVLSERLSDDDFVSRIRSKLAQLAAFRSGLEAMEFYTKRVVRDKAVQARRNPSASEENKVEIERLRLSVQPFASEIMASHDEVRALEKQIILAAGLGERMEREIAGSEMEARNAPPMASHIQLDGKAVRRTYGTPYALADDVLANMLQILDGDALEFAHNSALEAAYDALDTIQAQGMDLSVAPNIEQTLETFENTAAELKQAANSQAGSNIADLMYIVNDIARQEAERVDREFRELEAEEEALGISDSDAFMMGVEDAKNPQPTMDGGSVGEIYDHGRDRFEGYPRLLQSYLEGVDYITGDNIMEDLHEAEGETPQQAANRIANLPGTRRSGAIMDLEDMAAGETSLKQYYPHVKDLAAFAKEVLRLMGEETEDLLESKVSLAPQIRQDPEAMELYEVIMGLQKFKRSLQFLALKGQSMIAQRIKAHTAGNFPAGSEKQMRNREIREFDYSPAFKALNGLYSAADSAVSRLAMAFSVIHGVSFPTTIVDFDNEFGMIKISTLPIPTTRSLFTDQGIGFVANRLLDLMNSEIPIRHSEVFEAMAQQLDVLVPKLQAKGSVVADRLEPALINFESAMLPLEDVLSDSEFTDMFSDVMAEVFPR